MVPRVFIANQNPNGRAMFLATLDAEVLVRCMFFLQLFRDRQLSLATPKLGGSNRAVSASRGLNSSGCQ